MKSLNCSYDGSFSFLSQDKLENSNKNENGQFFYNERTPSLFSSPSPSDHPSSSKEENDKNRERQKTLPSTRELSPTENHLNTKSNKVRFSLIIADDDKEDIFEDITTKNDSLKIGNSLNKDPYANLKFISALNMDFVFDENVSQKRSYIPSKPYRVLDAPEMEDDFYKQLLHWSPQNNKIVIGLTNSVYIWDSKTKSGDLLCEIPDDEDLCSLKWSPSGDELLFGMSNGEIKLWDINENKLIQSMLSHRSKVSCLDWNDFGIFSGSKDKDINWIDYRMDQPNVKRFCGHSGQVLNLKLSPFNDPMILSSGNDSIVNVFDLRNDISCLMQNFHDGAVRAINWSPFQRGLFASGGASSDKMLKTWNLNTLQLIDEVFTGAQICDLTFGKTEKEIMVGLGGDINSVDIFQVKSLEKVGRLSGHRMRVLNMDLSPDGSELVSISADETMRFWKLNQF
jgi:cell division cycle 20-like protein 1 (cofactor of APC complex)